MDNSRMKIGIIVMAVIGFVGGLIFGLGAADGFGMFIGMTLMGVVVGLSFAAAPILYSWTKRVLTPLYELNAGIALILGCFLFFYSLTVGSVVSIVKFVKIVREEREDAAYHQDTAYQQSTQTSTPVIEKKENWQDFL